MRALSLCASCGIDSGDAGLCPHHHCVSGDDWAASNRIQCDFFHRGIAPTRLGEGERVDEMIRDHEVGFWA